MKRSLPNCLLTLLCTMAAFGVQAADAAKAAPKGDAARAFYARVADMTAFFSVVVEEDGSGRRGILVEYDATTKIFTTPSDKRTEDYVTGRFG